MRPFMAIAAHNKSEVDRVLTGRKTEFNMHIKIQKKLVEVGSQRPSSR